jgi:UDPglucose--hexose-1-phosphate uridylyltransferase
MAESEVRQNKVTREWVIFAPSRGKRPQDFKRARQQNKEDVPALDEGCPFCPDNEHMLPGILFERAGKEGESWQTRIVPNKFSAVTPNGNTDRSKKDLYIAMPGHGRHEVIIESPRHNHQVALMESTQVDAVVETYHRRYLDLIDDGDNMMILIFRNHGIRAGTSLIHPHSQLISTSFVPRFLRQREEEAERYFDEWGRCVFCDVLAYELRKRKRVVLENTSFAAFVPFAADVPFEVWIVPKRHQADFGQISDQEKSDLAAALLNILSRLYHKLNNPDYNYMINTSAQYRRDEPQLHWYLQIRPRLTTQAGFEIGSGISINPSFPEADADFLNEPMA